MKFRFIFLLALTAFAISMGITIGQRLSSEAMAMMMGFIVGVAASLPTCYAMVWALTRNLTAPPAPPPPETKVVVVSAPPNPAPANPSPTPQPSPVYNSASPFISPHATPIQQIANSQRKFTVIGGEDEERN
ncbi:MAG: DUF1418 family protein [Chloroflexi bacterium]|nr:DUF1418 family protein [Chloroflexota bacterium]